MAPVLESVPYRHDIWICGLVQHSEWHGRLADLAPPRVEPTAAVALISFAFGGGTHCDRSFLVVAKRKRGDTVGEIFRLFGLFVGGRRGATPFFIVPGRP